MSKPTNPPLFVARYAGTIPQLEYTTSITLRDVFAALAPDDHHFHRLRLGNHPTDGSAFETETARRYRYADEMLAERAK